MTVANKSQNSVVQFLLWPFKSYLRILTVVIFIAAYQYQSIQIDILAREIRSLELKRNQLINENATLRVQIDQLTHINRIEKIASEKFGLRAPGKKMEKLVIKRFDPDHILPGESKPDKIKLAGVH